MKLKQLPTDFHVEEINLFNFSPQKDSFQLFLLEKKGLETLAFLKYLCQKKNIPLTAVGIAGLKDKHAVTKQYLTISSQYPISDWRERNFSLKFLGYLPRPLKVGDLRSNKFTIIVRNLRQGEISGLREKFRLLQQFGVPNYFDSQRFGSVIHGKFIAKELLRENYEAAVKIYLTSYTEHESARVKEEKRRLREQWPNLISLYPQQFALKKIVSEYRQTKDWLSTYLKIPRKLREIYLSAYQSYLWNESLKELLRQKISPQELFNVPYAAGELYFYKKWSAEEKRALPPTLKMVSPRLILSATEEKFIVPILAREKITLADLEKVEKTGNFFKEYERPTFVIPENLELSAPEIDELNDKGRHNFFRLTLSFQLPKNAYATIVTKRIFKH